MPPSVPSSPVPVRDKAKVVISGELEKPIIAKPKVTAERMTRRFSVVEKIMIIDKYKETNNISETCRWVRKKFNRNTFARKSLSAMVANEKIYRSASGTKKIRKTVRPRTGEFHRMDKELAR